VGSSSDIGTGFSLPNRQPHPRVVGPPSPRRSFAESSTFPNRPSRLSRQEPVSWLTFPAGGTASSRVLLGTTARSSSLPRAGPMASSGPCRGPSLGSLPPLHTRPVRSAPYRLRWSVPRNVRQSTTSFNHLPLCGPSPPYGLVAVMVGDVPAPEGQPFWGGRTSLGSGVFSQTPGTCFPTGVAPCHRVFFS